MRRFLRLLSVPEFSLIQALALGYAVLAGMSWRGFWIVVIGCLVDAVVKRLAAPSLPAKQPNTPDGSHG